MLEIPRYNELKALKWRKVTAMTSINRTILKSFELQVRVFKSVNNFLCQLVDWLYSVKFLSN